MGESGEETEGAQPAGAATKSDMATEIEDDLIQRARAVYPATTTRKELVRRVFERGLCARESELAERDDA